MYSSQQFPFGAAFVCQAGNFWTLLRISSHENTTNRFGEWPVLRYYQVIFLNGLGRAVKTVLTFSAGLWPFCLSVFLYSLSYFRLFSMESGYTISRSNTWFNKAGNVRATIAAAEKQ
jgi:hypothetical protein